MQIKTSSASVFVFDLDDTLMREADYVRSAFRHIADTLAPQIGENLYEAMIARFHDRADVFGWLLQEHGERLPGVDLAWLLKEYREHRPQLTLAAEIAAFLEEAGRRNIPLGLISDGRSLTQRNKLEALGIAGLFAEVVISEEFGSAKPDERNFRHFHERFPGGDFWFFGDNTAKDFAVPAKLGWTTVCLRDQGEHIHPQDLAREPAPHHVINSFAEVELV